MIQIPSTWWSAYFNRCASAQQRKANDVHTSPFQFNFFFEGNIPIQFCRRCVKQTLLSIKTGPRPNATWHGPRPAQKPPLYPSTHWASTSFGKNESFHVVAIRCEPKVPLIRTSRSKQRSPPQASSTSTPRYRGPRAQRPTQPSPVAIPPFGNSWQQRQPASQWQRPAGTFAAHAFRRRQPATHYSSPPGLPHLPPPTPRCELDWVQMELRPRSFPSFPSPDHPRGTATSSPTPHPRPASRPVSTTTSYGFSCVYGSNACHLKLIGAVLHGCGNIANWMVLSCRFGRSSWPAARSPSPDEALPREGAGGQRWWRQHTSIDTLSRCPALARFHFSFYDTPLGPPAVTCRIRS